MGEGRIETMPVRPDALLALARAQEAYDLFAEGLRMHWAESYANGNIEAWRTLAHQIIDMMCNLPEVAPARRKEMVDG
jgi:hypothetical protein